MTTRIRDHWGVENGFPPGPVYAISQTRDGYLWIGTERGLVRFDGLSFRLIEHADTVKTVRPILGLTPDKDGDLWVRPRRPSLLRFRRGDYDAPMADFKPNSTTVAASALAADGSLLLWILKGEPFAAVLRESGIEVASKPAGFSRSPVLALTQLPDGEIWVGTRDAGLFRLRGNDYTAVHNGLPDPKVNCLLHRNGKELWIGTDNGLVRWNGQELTTAGIPPELRQGRILALAGDRQSNLWVGTNSKGLIRLDAQGRASAEDPPQSADAVTTLFEDREGSIWVGRANRLDRIRSAPFVAIEPTKGITIGPVVADPNGTVWAAPLNRGLLRIKGASVQRITTAGLENEQVNALAGSGNNVWIGRQSGAITRLDLDNGVVAKATTYDRSRGLPGNAVSAIRQTASGTVWAGTMGGGAIRLDGAGATIFTTSNRLASNVITSIAETADGSLWFGTPRGVTSLANGSWRTFASQQELPSANVNCLFRDSENTLWIGTVAGLARARSGQVESLASLLADNVLGVAEDRLGWLWIVTTTRVLRIDRRRLSSGSARAEDFHEYGRHDGFAGTAGARRQGSIIADASGSIWLASRDGMLTFDPRQATESTPRASVDIHSVSADGEPLRTSAAITVPPQRRRVTIGYTGLGLSSPDRVRFRYRLDPFDQNWSEPVAAREAVYTNLVPGDYKFRVIASNSDGQWNGGEASIDLTVQPAIWQRLGFRIGVGVALVTAMILLYQRRLHQLTQQMNLRSEERLAERTRIAQELHDTLLQGFLSASMQLHVAADSISDQSELKPQLNGVLDLMRQVIDEGRDAVRGLRSSGSQSLDIEKAFSTIPVELGNEDIDYRVITTGRPRPLHPILRDEVYRIGREAILNAFKHSGASKIEAAFYYAPHRLHVVVRDNGCGIEEAFLKRGREGHWGLSGMRERSERIGARLHVWSRPGNGTEVELDVPGHIAFRTGEPAKGRSWFRKLQGSKGFHEESHP